MKQPHKNAALIHAWADGAEAQYFDGVKWVTFSGSPNWESSTGIRIKPHKWQKEMNALAAGRAIESRHAPLPWYEVMGVSERTFDDDSLEFRIKPEVLRFRNYTCTGSDGETRVETTIYPDTQYLPNFLVWVGDWQETEA